MTTFEARIEHEVRPGGAGAGFMNLIPRRGPYPCIDVHLGHLTTHTQSSPRQRAVPTVGLTCVRARGCSIEPTRMSESDSRVRRTTTAIWQADGNTSMTNTRPQKKSLGKVVIHPDECKGCALCVDACPVGGLQIAKTTLNRLGYHPIEFLDVGCTGCGVCFYACPEPGALHVIRQPKAKKSTS